MQRWFLRITEASVRVGTSVSAAEAPTAKTGSRAPNIRVIPSQDVRVRHFAIDRPSASAQTKSQSHGMRADTPDTRKRASAAPRGGLCCCLGAVTSIHEIHISRSSRQDRAAAAGLRQGIGWAAAAADGRAIMASNASGQGQ